MNLDPSKVEHLYRSFRVCLGYAIRTAEEHDLPAIEKLRFICGLDPMPSHHRDRLISGELCLLLAELNGHPIGQICIQMNGESALFQELRVLDPMRGFGVAQHLIDEAEKVCGRSGCKITQLMISEQQDEARELLESMGYQVIDGERMEKDIRWKSCHTPPDDIAAEELCRADLDAALG